LLVTFAERHRRAGEATFAGAASAAVEGARRRLRPILMTSGAMLAGMVPMALALGEGGEQTAPLGRAVIGGLVAATFTTLLVLPAVTTTHPEPRTMRLAVAQPGQIEGFEQTPLFAKVAGYVRKYHADIGDRVRAGQVLAELSVPELDEELRQKEAAVSLAKAGLTQARRALKAAEAGLLKAEAAIRNARAGRDRAEANVTR